MGALQLSRDIACTATRINKEHCAGIGAEGYLLCTLHLQRVRHHEGIVQIVKLAAQTSLAYIFQVAVLNLIDILFINQHAALIYTVIEADATVESFLEALVGVGDVIHEEDILFWIQGQQVAALH